MTARTCSAALLVQAHAMSEQRWTIPPLMEELKRAAQAQVQAWPLQRDQLVP